MKVLNKLTLKNLRLNKTRTIVTIIGILLSTALITVVAGMATSAKQTMLVSEIAWSGDYDIALTGTNEDTVKDLNANRNVKNVYIEERLGCALLPDAKKENHPYVNIKALSKSAFTDCFQLSLSEGRLPENSSELVLSQTLIEKSGKKFKIGEKITLDVGTRTDDKGNVIPPAAALGTSMEGSNSGTNAPIQEKLVDTKSKTYTIVGILNEIYSNNLCDNDFSACTTAFTLASNSPVATATAEPVAYVDLKPECEKDYLKITSQITSLTEEEVSIATHDGMTDEMSEKSGFSDIAINYSVLRYKGYALGDETTNMLYSLAAIIIVIVILASVFVIRNSFAISITEKTKLYGMLASVGTTAKQIKRNVLFEGFCLGIIGIPLGLLLGIGVVGLLVVILNLLLAGMINGASFQFGVPLVALVCAAVLSAITILFSTLSIAFRASKIAPITAIRSNNDIKTSKKKKSYRTPKFIKKLYGTGGVIAYKNLKRSKKKYRTTVISIVISVMLFVAISSFMDYGMAFTNEYYGGYNYNIIISSYDLDENQIQEWDKQTAKINSLGSIESSISMLITEDLELICNDALTDNFLSYSTHAPYTNERNEDLLSIPIIATDDDAFEQIFKNLNIPDNDDGKAILYNSFTDYNGDNKKQTDKIFKDSGTFEFEYYNHQENKADKKIKVSASITQLPDILIGTGADFETCGALIVNRQWYKNYVSDSAVKTGYMCINSTSCDKLQDDIYDLGYDNLSVMNIDQMIQTNNAVMLIMGIFIYGFIAVITLIGVTNIFNTISTNMRLRNKEFAMLKSVGMTKKEFNRMIRLESLFYGIKSLLIGIPLGILGGIGIFFAFGEGNLALDFVIPWKAIIISIVFVFVVVWMIMKYSVNKVGKQNIIETIRNDNI